MSYTPSNFDPTNPTDVILAETAQAEFRNMKSFFQGTMGRSANAFQLSNTAATTPIFIVTIPANTMGTTKKLRATISGWIQNTTGLAQGFGVTFFFGATPFFSDVITIPDASTIAYKLIIEIANIGGSGVQSAASEYHFFANGSVNTGVSLAELPGFPIGGVNGTGTVNTTVDQNFIVYFTLGTASGLYLTTIENCLLEWM